LTEKGRNDARKVGAALSRLNLAAITSPANNQQIILDCLATSPLQTSDNLMEIDLPVGGVCYLRMCGINFQDYRRWQQWMNCGWWCHSRRNKGTLPSLSPVRTGAQFWQEFCPATQEKRFNSRA